MHVSSSTSFYDNGPVSVTKMIVIHITEISYPDLPQQIRRKEDLPVSTHPHHWLDDGKRIGGSTQRPIPPMWLTEADAVLPSAPQASKNPFIFWARPCSWLRHVVEPRAPPKTPIVEAETVKAY